MGGLHRTWLRLSGTIACAIAIMLPYRPRLFFARILNYLSNPVTSTIGLAFQRQARAWNRVVLALVFFLGFPLAKALSMLRGSAAKDPGKGAATYWVPRPLPEEFDRGIRETF